MLVGLGCRARECSGEVLVHSTLEVWDSVSGTASCILRPRRQRVVRYHVSFVLGSHTLCLRGDPGPADPGRSVMARAVCHHTAPEGAVMPHLRPVGRVRMLRQANDKSFYWALGRRSYRYRNTW